MSHIRRALGFCGLLLLGVIHTTAAPQTGKSSTAPPIETTICKIMEKPAAFNNKLVRISGLVAVGIEYFTVSSEDCSDQIWLAYGDRSLPPGYGLMIDGARRPRAKTREGRLIPPIPITLVRDSNFEKLNALLSQSAQMNLLPENFLRRQRVRATLIGRIDGVSKEIHEAHRKRSPSSKPDFKGFGQIDLFDAQLVIQQVESGAVIEPGVVKLGENPPDVGPISFPQLPK